MIIENTSDLIRQWTLLTLSDGSPVAEADCINPLAGGMVRNEAFADGRMLQPPFIEEHRAGFVGLTDGLAMLIGLNDVRMYPSKDDALRNQNMICELSLAVD